uniref:FTH domain-containing protein n=1 Tax=Caenorhabditis tropicalis TaxID=1561998 RepID=A0A1I7TFW4_9PELO
MHFSIHKFDTSFHLIDILHKHYAYIHQDEVFEKIHLKRNRWKKIKNFEIYQKVVDNLDKRQQEPVTFR